MNRQFFLFWILIAGCAGPVKQISIPDPEKSYDDLISENVSCTGNGKINSRGPIKGALTFTFMSQHDSSFFQFKDPLGRKALLMWLTPQNVAAWNLIENKQYTYNQILDFFPFLQIVEPSDITKFLWGIQPDYDAMNESENFSKSEHIQMSFKKNDLAHESKVLVSATFLDQTSNQSVEIQIKNRTRTQKNLNMKRTWELLKI